MPTVTHDEHGDDGRFRPTYDRHEFIDAVAALDLPTTSDVAEYIGEHKDGIDECPHRTALHWLNELEDAGELSSRSVGRAKVWSAAETETDESGPERRERAPADTPVDLDSFEYKRDLTAARRDVLTDWVDHVRATGDSVKKSDFEAWFTEDYKTRAGYDFGGFWEMFAKATMKQSDRFEKPNSRAYRYTDETGE